MKKKWLLIFSALLTVTSLVACSNSKEETTSKKLFNGTNIHNEILY